MTTATDNSYVTPIEFRKGLRAWKKFGYRMHASLERKTIIEVLFWNHQSGQPYCLFEDGSKHYAHYAQIYRLD